MKTRTKKSRPSTLSLGEMIAVVSSCARSERESLAAVLDLLRSGRVRIRDHGHDKRVKFSPL